MTNTIRIVTDILPAQLFLPATSPYATYTRSRVVLTPDEVLVYAPHDNRAVLALRERYANWTPPDRARGLGGITLASGEVWQYKQLKGCGCHDVLGAVPLGADLQAEVEM